MTKLFLNLSLFFISFTPPLFAQTLKGRVVDETTQQPIVGVGVQVIGTSQGTITNTEGEFALNVIQWPVEVVFSHVSYQTQKIKAKTSSSGINRSRKRYITAFFTVTINRYKNNDYSPGNGMFNEKLQNQVVGSTYS